jgi:hypothetical protein
MSKLQHFITGLFFKRKDQEAPGSIPKALLRVNDWDGLYNYFIDVITYHTEHQNFIEGYNRSLNKPNWVVELCQDLNEKINQFRAYHSKDQIPLSIIHEKEEQATSQKEYLLTFALYCTDLCVK